MHFDNHFPSKKTLFGAVTLVTFGLFCVRATPIFASATSCDSDINQSGLVDLSDYSILVQSFFQNPLVNARADINHDGRADLIDYSFLVKDFLTTCQINPTNTPIVPTSSPVQVPTTSPSATPIPSSAIVPGQIIDLSNWKLQLPTGANGTVTEIKQPGLATYQYSPWFVSSSDGKAVRFRAPVNAPVTTGTSYPRCELREMTSNGATQAGWSSSSGTHTMFIDEAITAVPLLKPHVIAGQIVLADNTSDVLQLRLEKTKLFLKVGSANGPTVDVNYTLGKRLTLKYVVNNNVTQVYYNNNLVYTLNKSYSGYFKTGVYTISNCSTEAAGDCTDNNYGEVMVYKAVVTHQ